jgi:DNA-binding Lrp family transcriptional regulator
LEEARMHRVENKAGSRSKECRTFCALVLVALTPNAYRDPEKTAQILARYREVESVDIAAGKWDLILQIRTKNQDMFYEFLKNIISEENRIVKTSSIVSLKRVKPVSS